MELQWTIKSKQTNKRLNLFNLQEIEGLEKSSLTLDGAFSKGCGAHYYGFKTEGTDYKLKLKGSASKDPHFYGQLIWRPCADFVIGA